MLLGVNEDRWGKGRSGRFSEHFLVFFFFLNRVFVGFPRLSRVSAKVSA